MGKKGGICQKKKKRGKKPKFVRKGGRKGGIPFLRVRIRGSHQKGGKKGEKRKLLPHGKKKRETSKQLAQSGGNEKTRKKKREKKKGHTTPSRIISTRGKRGKKKALK